jgi:hypothetical protein
LGKHFHVTAFEKLTAEDTEPKVPAKRGRPKGKPSLAVALSHELINSKADKVVKKVLEIALNDAHPKQLDALKMCFDRIAPVSVFEKVAEHQKNKGIEININVVGSPTSIEPLEHIAHAGLKAAEVVDVVAREVKHEES